MGFRDHLDGSTVDSRWQIDPLLHGLDRGCGQKGMATQNGRALNGAISRERHAKLYDSLDVLLPGEARVDGLNPME